MKALTNPWLSIPGYNCFVCSPDNPIGLKMKFFLDGDNIVSIFPLNRNHQGWIDTLHGGLQATMLDEICAWQIIHLLGTSGVTGKMEVRYKRPVPTTWKYVVVRAEVISRKGKVITLRATISSPDGLLCAEAQCIYFSFPPEKAEEMKFSTMETYGKEMTIEEAAEWVMQEKNE